MKKLALLLFFIGGLVSAQAQESISTDSINKTNKGLLLKLGLNLVDSSGKYNPFEFLSSFDEMAFSENFNIELEYRFSNSLSLSVAWSNNKWKANKGRIDGAIIPSDVKYSAIDLDLKYYYNQSFGGWFDRNDWLELYLHGGVGRVSQADQSGMTLNVGPGVNIWFSDQFGLNLNGTGKWTLNKEEYNSNHFQYSTSLMYRFASRDKDDDNDGVRNKMDDCPNVSGVAQNNGCPEEADSDGDGVVDAMDKCPEAYGTDNGCPEVLMEADTDGDSVLDSADKCPKIKGLPTNNGCPLPDSDNDGIVDVADKCPNVPGVESNNGCPYEEIEIGTTDTNLNIVSKGILFNSGNSNFRQESYPVLIKVVEMMKQHPEAQFKIEGHTDSSGGYDSNKRLSQTRANAVRNYLISSGIPSENLIAEGFGETRPVVSNLTGEGRRLNRRVEIIRTK
jgi:outer membrane protein OmpA-like peptidoglycan-associated protein